MSLAQGYIYSGVLATVHSDTHFNMQIIIIITDCAR